MSFWSQSEEALRDTLVKKAEGPAFDRIATHHGFNWVKAISEGAWRGALAGMVYDARDTFPVFFATLTKALSDFIEVFDDCYFTPTSSTAIFRPSGWDPNYINRYIRINGVVYYSVGRVPGDMLLLSSYATSYWAKPAFSVDEVTPITAVEVLPFLVWEPSVGPTYPGWNEQTYSGGINNTVQVEVWPHLAFFPETYLQEPTEYLTADPGVCPIDGGDVCTPESMPNGGYLLETDIEDLEEDYTVAYPVYLGDGDVAPSLRAQFDRLLIAGNWLDMYATNRVWNAANRVSAYYESPGGVDDTLIASTNVAARLIFPGSVIADFTILMWVQQLTSDGINFFQVGASDAFQALCSGRAEQDFEVTDGGSTVASGFSLFQDTDVWQHAAYACASSVVTPYSNGVAGTGDTVSGTFSAQSLFQVLPSNEQPGRVRNIVVFARALSAIEIAAVFSAKEHHDIRNPAAGWPGEVPAILWQGQAVDGAVPNLGYAGLCSLVLSGMVASLED